MININETFDLLSLSLFYYVPSLNCQVQQACAYQSFQQSHVCTNCRNEILENTLLKYIVNIN